MKKKNGFTLLELLVVVLIIGILAAIALPQYKLAVAKSQYNTLKNVTKSLKESVERFYLANNKLPSKFADLDIDLNIISERTSDVNSFYIYFPGVDSCEIYFSDINDSIICSKTITGVNMRYAYHTFTGYKTCDVYSLDTSDVPNKVCQNETGRTPEQASCSASRCRYNYR